MPSTLDWNLWLGPIRERPYNPVYAPHGWRGWRDFGTGALGDMGCHIIDHPVWALRLGAPTSRRGPRHARRLGRATDKPNSKRTRSPRSSLTSSPRAATLPPVRMTWYDGGLMPPTPAGDAAGQRLPDNGVLYVGSKGKMYHGSHGGMPQLLPAALHEQAKPVPKTMTRSPGHYEEWLAACKGGPRPVANFDYAGPLTEIVLLGVLALRAPGRGWNGTASNMKVKNAPSWTSTSTPNTARAGRS